MFPISQSPAAIGLCAYRDLSGMFTTKIEDYSDPNSAGGQSYAGAGFGGYMKPEPNNPARFEDEEDLLYGEKGSSFKMKNVSDDSAHVCDFSLKISLNRFVSRLLIVG